MGFRSLVRTMFAFATFAVVWLVVSPARANEMAPLCDPRGAITFAPPPQMQDEERSIDIPADCVDVNPLETDQIAPGRRAPPEISFSREPGAVNTVLLLPPTFEERVPIERGAEGRPSSGVRSSVERPPRA